MKSWLTEYGIHSLLLFVIFLAKMLWNLKMYSLSVSKPLNLVIYVALYSSGSSYQLSIMTYVCWMSSTTSCCFRENYSGAYESSNGKLVERYLPNVAQPRMWCRLEFLSSLPCHKPSFGSITVNTTASDILGRISPTIAFGNVVLLVW